MTSVRTHSREACRPRKNVLGRVGRVVRFLSPLLILVVAACASDITDRSGEADAELLIAGNSGMITVEAAKFTKLTRAGGHYWRTVNDRSAVGGRWLEAAPDNGRAFSSRAGPRADYRVNFPAAGTYYVWVHGKGVWNNTRTSDSLHIGLNRNAPQYTSSNISGLANKPSWMNKNTKKQRSVLKVARAGTQTVNVWMGEDGLKFDSLVFTRDSSAKPANVARTSAPTGGTSAGRGNRLSWSPPKLSNPRVVNIAARSSRTIIELNPRADYIIKMPSSPVTRGIIFVGGRNIVLIGGEIAIPWQGRNASIASRTGLKIKNATGTVHVEGLLIRGDDLSEGIQINAPKATVQLQNIGIFNMHARDQVRFRDNHPDLIQTYGNVKRLRIDSFTGVTDYQGLFLSTKYNGAHGPVDLKRVNIIGERTARNLLWIQPQSAAGSVTLDRVYLDSSGTRKRNLGEAVYPSIWNVSSIQARLSSGSVTWPRGMRPRVSGAVNAGRPPGGSYVLPSSVGTRYRSPGY